MQQRRWLSGTILACHAGGPGSIPGRRSIFYCKLTKPSPRLTLSQATGDSYGDLLQISLLLSPARALVLDTFTVSPALG